jgi:N-acetylglucosaminyl-diphospho-decaprenol L-rhamnosyltransferase
MPDLSIIFVNWNSTDYLIESVESIYANTKSIQFEIIVVDNCSPKGDVGDVKRRFPDVLLIESPVNLGFSGANNLGFRASRGEFVVFLNPDTLLINPAFDLMLAQVRSYPSLGAIGCTLLNGDRSIQTSAIQTFPTIINQLLDIDVIRNLFPGCPLWNIKPLFAGGDQPSVVEVISGACLMLRREVFAQVGQFSEEYFMYSEDLDLCYKVAKAGYTNLYVPQGQIIHYGGKSSAQNGASRLQWKSRLIYAAKFHGSGYQVIYRMAMAGAALLRMGLLLIWTVVCGRSRRPSALAALAKWWMVLKTMTTFWEKKEALSQVTA